MFDRHPRFDETFLDARQPACIEQFAQPCAIHTVDDENDGGPIRTPHVLFEMDLRSSIGHAASGGDNDQKDAAAR
jgi:hypothetical protein